MAANTLPPLSLYVHIPWCEKKCPYCDFNSHVSQAALPEAEYLSALKQDLISQQTMAAGRLLQSIFIGGGTPSLFHASTIAAILDAAQSTIGFAPNIEITMEANPGSSEQKKFSDLRAAGVNRLSIGVQSFNDEALQQLGRIHNRGLADSAILAAQAAGFERINLDLMHGLPGQTPTQALDDIQHAIATGVEHISWYQLTIEPNTEFYRFPPRLPEDDLLADIQDQGAQRLNDNGFSQYEISAWSKPGSEARHNINYWQFGDYLAIGAGAHGKITAPETREIQRFNNTRLPRDYLKRIDSYIAQRQTLTRDEALFEGLMNALRLSQGMAVNDLLNRTGAMPAELSSRCQPLVEQGLLQLDDRISATDLGRRYLNLVLEKLLDD
ncbi:Oxygen-independent coproporphyrinogen-III oxidase-like protein YqeR [BD1-7 clade bacterium]|uniref:Heme chaperone HemW n=1 Tax=BD1-7 clade bacterium TaxID=2029982 RepID=A0A5S9N0K1_9GAMM|nr:Oxygen-independent coproporphyrinogen-III oxidase-like protein YqeR [BD1-7 clade bacterium]CAA0082751.1 Oxygen-independent coproporphyrinogen-III oxidase-like protein YqeR [BD1-7 clade bacterium]